MGETSNIAEMAMKISREIFEVFGWETVPPADQDWACVTPDHQKKKHPTDVVFRYRHPYRPETVHLNTDLKSFAAATISKREISKALRSLAMSTACAALSSEWQDMYASPDINLRVSGLLFIYNHDNNYNGDFQNLILESEATRTGMPTSATLHVLSPDRISYLATVSNDIINLRGHRSIPDPGRDFWFFYPDLIGDHVRVDQPQAATIETLCGPLIVCRYLNKRNSPSVSGALVYYGRSGSTIDEYKYLIDYLFRYQIIINCDEVRIRIPAAANNATAVFGRAVTAYLEDFHALPEIRDRLSRIKIEPVTSIIKNFSEVALGMERL